MENSLVAIVESNGIEEAKAKTLLDSFSGMFQQAKEWEEKAKLLVVTDATQIQAMKDAHVARMALKDIRVQAEKTRKDLKEDYVRNGKAVDGIANVIKALIVPIEEYLEKQEKFAEIQEEARKDKVTAERATALSPYVENTAIFNLREMSEEAFAQLLDSSKIAKEAREEAAKKALEEKAKAEALAAEQKETEAQISQTTNEAPLKAAAPVGVTSTTTFQATKEPEEPHFEFKSEKEILTEYADRLLTIPRPLGLSSTGEIIVQDVVTQLKVLSDKVKDRLKYLT